MKSLTLRTLDAKAARLCKLRAGGRCERCGSTRALECSHFIGRTHLLTRWDLDNLDCLCRECHRDFTRDKGHYEVWKRFVKPGPDAVFANLQFLQHERIPTTKTLWMQAENERLDAALREMAA